MGRPISTCKAFSCGTAASFLESEGWTQVYQRGLTTVRFDHPAQQAVRQNHIHTVMDAEAHVARLTRQIERLIASWSMAPAVADLRAMRGVALLAAVTVVREVGNFSRFANPAS